MNRKTTLDIAILISCFTGMILSYVYLDNYIEKEISLLILGITGPVNEGEIIISWEKQWF